MGYNMKRGNSAVPFKELGSSPAKDMPHEPNGIPPGKAAMMNKMHADAEHPHELTPAKQTTKKSMVELKTKIDADEKNKAFRKRNTAILNNDNAQEKLHNDLDDGNISQEEFDVKIAELRKEEKEIKKALPK